MIKDENISLIPIAKFIESIASLDCETTINAESSSEYTVLHKSSSSQISIYFKDIEELINLVSSGGYSKIINNSMALPMDIKYDGKSVTIEDSVSKKSTTFFRAHLKLSDLRKLYISYMASSKHYRSLSIVKKILYKHKYNKTILYNSKTKTLKNIARVTALSSFNLQGKR